MNPAKDPADDPAADPFLKTPGSTQATGLDKAAPPPPGGRVDLPPPPSAQRVDLPAPPPAPQQFAAHMTADPGAPFPPVAARWRRSWGVTMLRTAIGFGVALVISVPLVIVLSVTATDPYLAGYAFGAVIAPILSYFTFFAWWLDHVTARWGRWGSFLMQGGVSFVLASIVAMGSANAPSTSGRPSPLVEAGIPPGILLVVWLLVWPAAHFLASLLKGSFPPKR